VLCLAFAEGLFCCHFGPIGEYITKNGENIECKFAKMHSNIGIVDFGI